MGFRNSMDISKAAQKCIYYINQTERNDILDEDFHFFLGRLIGVFSVGISYQEAIIFLGLTGHGLNSSTLVRSQLEAFLILYYLTEPKDDLSLIEKRVHHYEEWVIIKMYLNSKKSGTYELFTLHETHNEYLSDVEENYLKIKETYADNPSLFKELEKSQSFLKNKKEIAKIAGIEDLYNAIFAETSATVHIADISDRMTTEEKDGREFFEYKVHSKEYSMMPVGLSNILLMKSIALFSDFFKFSKETKKQIFKNVQLAKIHLSKTV